MVRFPPFVLCHSLCLLRGRLHFRLSDFDFVLTFSVRRRRVLIKIKTHPIPINHYILNVLVLTFHKGVGTVDRGISQHNRRDTTRGLDRIPTLTQNRPH